MVYLCFTMVIILAPLVVLFQNTIALISLIGFLIVGGVLLMSMWTTIIEFFLRSATYYVSADATEGGDGSEANPFKNIQQALDHGFTDSITIHVGGGTYPENLSITRNTTILGMFFGHTIIEGSITNPGFDLSIKTIHIREAQGRAIIQNGGTLSLEYVFITRTRNIEGDATSGRALEVTNGANVTLAYVDLSHNDGQALLVLGENTKVKALLLMGEGNHVNPELISDDYYEQVGTIEVADGGKLFVEVFDFRENECITVLIRDGGLAHLRNGRVVGTKIVNNKWGDNFNTKSNGKLQLHDFESTTAERCGLYLDNGYLKLVDGEVKENLIGIHVGALPEDYDFLACCDQSVLYSDNQVRLDALIMPLPSLDPLPPCPDLVPWE